MNKRQIKKLEMYVLVRNLIQNTDSVIINLMPRMSIYLSELVENIIAINTDGDIQIKKITGVTDTKDHLKDDLITKTTEVARKVQSYAADISDFDLLKDVKYTYPSLERLNGAILKIICLHIYTKAKEHLSELATYGIDADVLLIFKEAIDDFVESNPKTREGIINKKFATRNLKQIFTDTDLMLTFQMDTAVGIVKNSHASFYEHYFDSRKLEKPSSHPLAIRCLIVDVEGNPIPNAAAFFSKNKSTFKTKEKGFFYVRNFLEGKYQVTVTRMGYVTQIITVIVSSGKRTDVKVVMTAVEDEGSRE